MSEDEQEFYTKEQIEAAQRFHQSHYQGALQLGSTVITYGTEAMKAAAFIAGGSAAALLAFMSALVGKDQLVLASWLPWPLAAFVISLFFACVASSISYLTQLCYNNSRATEKLTWKWPYSEETKISLAYNWAGRILHVLAILAMLGSYITLIVGYLAAYRAITEVGFHLPAKP